MSGPPYECFCDIIFYFYFFKLSHLLQMINYAKMVKKKKLIHAGAGFIKICYTDLMLAKLCLRPVNSTSL